MEKHQKEQIIKFLKEEVQERYNSPLYCFSGLEIWAERYNGPYRKVLDIAMKYLSERNRGATSRVFCISNFTLEKILDKISQEVQ